MIDLKKLKTVARAFDKCTDTRIDQETNTLTISCNKGLWRVSGRTDEEDQLTNVAHHYFRQYYEDGEYADQLEELT